MNKQDIQKIYPLTGMQEGMLFHDVKGDDAGAYIEQFVFTLQGDVDPQRFEDCVNHLIARHEVLRTVFRYKKLSRSMQVVLKERKLTVSFEDLRDRSDAVQREAIRERRHSERTQGFQLSRDMLLRVVLIRTGERDYQVIWTHHHILMDGWCVSLLMKDFMHMYQSLATGEPVRLAPVKPYSDYVNWLQQQDHEEAAAYWTSYLEGCEQTAVIPSLLRPKSGAAREYVKEAVTFTLSREETAGLVQLARQHQVTLNVVFQSIWGLLLQAYNGTKDVVFGSVVSGRPPELPGVETMVGLFINTIPVRIQCGPDQTLAELLGQVQVQAVRSASFDFASLAEIQAGSRLKRELFQHIVVFENYPVEEQLKQGDEIPGNGFAVRSVQADEQTNYDFNVLVIPGEELAVELVYNSQVYDALTIGRIEGHLRQLIAQCTAQENRYIRGLHILTPEETLQLEGFRGYRHAYPEERTIQDLFEAQAERTPERTAVVWGSRRLSYGELNARANQLAHTLRSRGVQPNTVVGLMTERSADMLIGLLAILKAGGAYLPLQPQDPDERRRFMLHDSGAALLLTQRHWMENVSFDGEKLAIDDGDTADDADSCNPPQGCSASDLAYVIYTSGSTGQPKGVGIEHASVVNLLYGLQREVYGYSTEPLKVALLASHVFDASVQQIGSALLFGHTLHVLPEECRTQPRAFMSYIRAHGIEVCDGTPSHLAFLCAEGARIGNGVDEAQQRAGSEDKFLPSGPAADEVLRSGRSDEKALRSGSAAEIAAGAEGAAAAAPSGLRHLLVGGEALTRSTVRGLWHAFADPGLTIWNVYGPTECCVDAVIHPIRRTEFLLEDGGVPGSQMLPIGRPLPNVQCYILSADDQLQPIGVPGELCIGGDGVARGYVNRPELTAERFTLNHPHIPGGRIYRTGDLVRWLPGGELEYLGRMDGQVKIRGYRVETGEIEAKLLAHNSIREAAVTAFDEDGGRQALCAYITAAPGQDAPAPAELRAYLARSLPEYMLPSRFVAVERLPLTPSGKLDRRALPRPQEGGGREAYAAPRDKREAALARIWQELLGVERVGLRDHFFELGGHSLKAMSLAARIHKELHVEAALRDLFANPTLEEMTAHLGRLERSAYSAIAPVPEQPYYAVSSAQKRLYVLAQLEGLQTSYNMPGAFRLSGAWDKTRMEGAFAGMIGRHEALRTSFGLEGGEPVQYVHPSAAFELEALELEPYAAFGRQVFGTPQQPPQQGAMPLSISADADGGPELRRLVARFIRPFDLSRAPLLRAGLLPLPGGEALLLVDLHHIVSDGVSMNLFVREWLQLYRGETLQPLPLQYKDYAAWQRERLRGEEMQRQEAYWLERLAGELPVLNLPADDPRPAQQSFEGGRVRLALPQELTRQLQALCAAEGLTLSMLLLASFQVLLARYSGQEDVIVGMPVAGRPHADLDSVLGMFVNTLALRGRPQGEKTFLEFLREVKEGALEAYEHQDYPFEQLVQQLQLPRDLSRNPVFDVMFVMQNTGQARPPQDITEGSITPFAFDNPVSKFDLTLQAAERMDPERIVPETIELELEYAAKLFSRASAERMIRHYEQLLGQIVQSPELKLAELEVLTAAERRLLLERFNDTGADYPREQTIHGLFEAQAARTPDRVAVVMERERLTYRELNGRANRLARVLRERGAGVDTPVGILAERSPEMIVGLLAILKAGAAYVPLDPEYPQERIRYMLEDSGASLVLTTLGDVKLGQTEIIRIQEAVSSAVPSGNPEPVGTSRSLAYIMYTSGSTGRPKGVMIEHHSVVNRIHWMQKSCPLQPDDVILQKTSISFDVSVWELFWWAMAGAQLCLLPPGHEKEPRQIIKAIDDHGVTTLHFVPSMLQQFVEHIRTVPEVRKLISVRRVFASGEALGLPLARRFQEELTAPNGTQLINLYGPTEATVDVSFFDCAELGAHHSSVPIGRPIDNMQLYILDRHRQPVPLLASGELYIGGAGLARGYWNRPELTAERFAANPFRPGELLYRTGDAARWLPDGVVEYLGRLDHQVKIRGYRIELGEIETQLLQLDSLKEAVVIAREEEETYLCAYVTASIDIRTAEIRLQLAGRLPSFMIPRYIIRLERMPLTPSGKVDRASLPSPEVHLEQETYQAPRSETEMQLAALWEEVLGIGRIGITDNYFNLGGDSIKAIRLMEQLRSRFGVELTLKDLYAAPSIADLSRLLPDKGTQADQAAGHSTKRDEIKNQLDELKQKLLGGHHG
ncbi:non-ribosomal peptide synthetase [Paenibacillus caseinilyticus]|uniref:non-ribosomal peptide synthetase n=1 Tax=Paenibacillus caseinilyticus TaxID=3098138 RepID=UPI0022B9040E|nr:non-ribosomal peptide synthetase [Paenibacillus caseinilyticus]MCZ8521356.1 amino acid adenylation domain-containing protein [Paenibacillus caseinilyticus]